MGFGREQLAAISRLFGSSVIREMARRGKSPLFTTLARQSLLLNTIPTSERVQSVFEKAFSILSSTGCRDEYVYKAALTQRILLGTHSLNTASMLTEFRVGDCKADVVILNGTATAYEVKSERDSLIRLERQIAAYGTVFARVYVIASDVHVNEVFRSVPKHVGVMVLNRRQQISTLREAVDRADHTSPAAMFNAVRTNEARMILSSRGISVPVVPNTVLNSVLRQLFIKLNPREAQESMVQVLKETRNLLPLSCLIDQLPPSLQTAALSIPLRKMDHTRLVGAMQTRLQDALTWG